MENLVEVVQPRVTVLSNIDSSLLIGLERYGRICYKSEDKITEGSAKKFVSALIKMGHESVIEHVNITVHFVCDRGVTHELVRHRIASYSQESTRYCDYSGGIQVIAPIFWHARSDHYKQWLEHMESSARAYLLLRGMGASPQEARSVLPNSLKTEIVVTANLREWRHILKLRTSRKAHPQMREVMLPLLKQFQEQLPVVFDYETFRRS